MATRHRIDYTEYRPATCDLSFQDTTGTCHVSQTQLICLYSRFCDWIKALPDCTIFGCTYMIDSAFTVRTGSPLHNPAPSEQSGIETYSTPLSLSSVYVLRFPLLGSTLLVIDCTQDYKTLSDQDTVRLRLVTYSPIETSRLGRPQNGFSTLCMQ